MFFRDIGGDGGGGGLWYPFLVAALMREPFCESRRDGNGLKMRLTSKLKSKLELKLESRIIWRFLGSAEFRDSGDCDIAVYPPPWRDYVTPM